MNGAGDISYPLEGKPTDEQKTRLDDWLMELLFICRKYRLLLDTSDGDTRVIDVRAGDVGHVIGLGLQWTVIDRDGQPYIDGYECAGSIHDGVWLVDTDEGPREQRHVGSVHVHREDPPA